MSKPDGPGVIRASIVFVWQLGQSGRWMNMMLRLRSGGSVTELSVTDGCRKGAVMSQYVHLILFRDGQYSSHARK